MQPKKENKKYKNNKILKLYSLYFLLFKNQKTQTLQLFRSCVRSKKTLITLINTDYYNPRASAKSAL